MYHIFYILKFGIKVVEFKYNIFLKNYYYFVGFENMLAWRNILFLRKQYWIFTGEALFKMFLKMFHLREYKM